MKKIMIAVAIVCAAVVSQAATCKWTSGSLKTAADKDGGWSGTAVNTAGALVTMNVYFIDATTYDSLAGKTQKELFDAYSTATADLSGVNKNASGTLIGAITINDDAKAIEGDMYAVVTGTYTDATYGDMFMATLKKSAYNAGTQTGSAGNILSTVGSWQAAESIPEPTSGLLLLLGMAGLSLRRRHA